MIKFKEFLQEGDILKENINEKEFLHVKPFREVHSSMLVHTTDAVDLRQHKKINIKDFDKIWEKFKADENLKPEYFYTPISKDVYLFQKVSRQIGLRGASRGSITFDEIPLVNINFILGALHGSDPSLIVRSKKGGRGMSSRPFTPESHNTSGWRGEEPPSKILDEYLKMYSSTTQMVQKYFDAEGVIAYKDKKYNLYINNN